MWVKRESKSRPGVEYYFNTASGETRWEPPSDLDKKRASGEGGGSPEKRQKTEETCHALHLLCKHAGSRRPSSHRTKEITMTKEEARAELEVRCTKRM